MLNLIITVSLFFLLVLSTFVIIDIPFISFFITNFPENIIVNYSDQYISYGFIQINLQLCMIIASAMLLKPRLYFTFMLIYLSVGVYGVPIFFNGGGVEYFKQSSSYYLLTAITISFFASIIIWRYNKQLKLLNSFRFTFFISMCNLIFTNIIGAFLLYFTSNFQISLWNIIKSYFILPFSSYFILLIILSFFSTNINIVKFYLMNVYIKFKKDIVTSTKRRISTNAKIK